jgi:cell division protein FtsN
MAQKQNTSPWVWAALLLILGSFVAFVLFLDQELVSKGSDKSAQTRKSSPENKPTIDFYTVLPQRKVEISIPEQDRAAIENPSINKDIVGQAILQVGSFHSAEEADSLKAQLALLGLEARVKSAVVNDDTWHRVQLGPFDSETKLSQAKNLLIENHFRYMQRSLP